MNIFIGILIWIAIFLAYFTIESIISIFFTYKISYVAQENYKLAAFNGATSTFLFMFSTLLAAVISQTEFSHMYFFNSSILFIVWTTLGTATGNFTATIMIPKINKIISKAKKEKKEED